MFPGVCGEPCISAVTTRNSLLGSVVQHKELIMPVQTSTFKCTSAVQLAFSDCVVVIIKHNKDVCKVYLNSSAVVALEDQSESWQLYLLATGQSDPIFQKLQASARTREYQCVPQYAALLSLQHFCAKHFIPEFSVAIIRVHKEL